MLSTPTVSADELSPATEHIELAVIIPTYNERDNILPLLNALSDALSGDAWEIIFVDDHSPDGTAESVRRLAAVDRRIRVIERIGRRGLSSACIEGMLSTPAAYLAVMDADMQHDESILPQMLKAMKAHEPDLVVASRNVEGGSMGEFAAGRVLLSQIGARLVRYACRLDVSDPMSGFFLVNRTFFRLVAHRLTGTGFKLLVDLLASSPRPVRIIEAPYCFRNRTRGASKLDLTVQLEFLYLIVDKLIGSVIPTRFVLFLLVGLSGVLVHFTAFSLSFRQAHWSFFTSQCVSTFVAMTFNFLLNNAVTFRDRRLHGWRLIAGALKFYGACSIGAFINLRLADFLHTAGSPWYLAGLSGATVSALWNYGVNEALTWGRARKSA